MFPILGNKPENIIERFEFSKKSSPKAIISGKSYTIFNSNDYLGLRFHPDLLEAEHQSAKIFGTGPGAVRFISGSLQIHKDLEKAIADFHHKEDAIIFSSAFAANFSSISTLASNDTLIVSDQLNHRSIIDGIRVANLPPENRQIYRHLDYDHLREILTQNTGKFKRCLVISDGVFSMLGEIVSLKILRQICNEFNALLYIDDAHGVGVIGDTGRGSEEYCRAQADVLCGTLGKAFGCDGGYITASKTIIAYLRETAAGYIYSNNLSPGTAGAALASINLVSSSKGQQILNKLHQNMKLLNINHAIKPVILGDPQKTLSLKQKLFEHGILVTAINYPVVPQGADEIRLQLSASHTQSEIEILLSLIDDSHT